MIAFFEKQERFFYDLTERIITSRFDFLSNQLFQPGRKGKVHTGYGICKPETGFGKPLLRSLGFSSGGGRGRAEPPLCIENQIWKALRAGPTHTSCGTLAFESGQETHRA